MIEMNKMNEPVLIVDLRFTCYIPTNDCISFESKKERIIVEGIIRNYFSKIDKESIQLEQVWVKKKHVEISFKASASVNLPKFISNLKSVTSRAIKKSSSGIWKKNYLIVSGNAHLDTNAI